MISCHQFGIGRFLMALATWAGMMQRLLMTGSGSACRLVPAKKWKII